MTEQSVLEIGARLKSPPAESMVNSAFASELERQAGLFSAMGLVDLAYTITGIESGIIPARAGGELLSKLLELQAWPDDYSPQPETGDLYTNREAWLVRHTAAAGWLGAGRARREATTSAFLVLQRQQLLALLASLIHFGQALRQRAAECSAACMPDYTYLQAAQPTTFGHYLAGFIYPLLRDCDRAERLYRRVNASPMGCGSTTGSALAVNRQRMASLGGFDTLATHTRDAMWQPDVPIETAALLCTVSVNLSRLAEDLLIFSSREFALVELADRHARASKIMPHKKNPFALTHIRSTCNELMGLMTSVNAMARTPSGQPDNRLWIYGALPDAVSGLTDSVVLFTDVIRNLEFRRERAMQLLEDAALMATDLAEALVLRANVDYRSAYRLVAKLVDEYRDKGGIGQLDAGALRQSAVAFLGREVSIEEADVRHALDPRRAMEAHVGPGAPAQGPMADLLEDCRRQLSHYQSRADVARARLRRAEKQLLDTARELCSG